MQATFSTQEEAAAYWLDLLKDGTTRQRARARTELGIILEQRGLLDEAAQAYRANVEAGVQDRQPYERLAALCRQRGDREGATRVLARLAAVLEERWSVDAEPAPAQPRLVGASALDRPSRRSTMPARDQVRPWVPMGWVVFGGAAALGIVLTTIVLVMTGRGAVDRLGLPFAGSRLTSCADAAGRFPGAHDPVAAVTRAYERNGVAVDVTNGGRGAFVVASAPKIVGGWIGVSLLREQDGQSAPSLAEWLSREPNRPTLMNLLLAGRTLDRQISIEEWESLVAAPVDSCEGAFIHDPKNIQLVQLIALVVDD